MVSFLGYETFQAAVFNLEIGQSWSYLSHDILKLIESFQKWPGSDYCPVHTKAYTCLKAV